MKENGIQHIIWDWNGTLLDDISACLATINLMLVKRGLPLLTIETYREIFGFPVRDCYIKLGFDLNIEDWDAVSQEFHSIYRTEAMNVKLRDGIPAVLETLLSRGKAMYVLSASELSILTDMLDSRGIGRYFKNVYGHSDLYGSSKMVLGRKFLKDTGIPAEQVLFIGDTDHDYEVARELNCQCILLAGGHQATERLQKCGCRIVENVTEFLGVL
jgi:phosphoglycolate phosphatase